MEEHTVISKKLLTGLIQCIIAVHILLMLFDGFPKLLTIFSAASHGVYLANVTKAFPMGTYAPRLQPPRAPVLMSLQFGLRIRSSCCPVVCFLPRSPIETSADLNPGLVIANHFLWFKHFSHPQLASDHPNSAAYRAGGLKGSPYDYSNTADPYFPNRFPTFTEISAFFGICVWMVPFALFVSLSASDNVLPSSEIPSGSVGSGGFGGVGTQKNKGPGIAKMVFNHVMDYTTTSGEALGLWSSAGRHERFE